MSILVVIGIMLAVPVTIAVVLDLRLRSGRVNTHQIDADKANSLTTWIGDAMSTGEYLPPPRDDRPPH